MKAVIMKLNAVRDRRLESLRVHGAFQSREVTNESDFTKMIIQDTSFFANCFQQHDKSVTAVTLFLHLLLA